MNYLPNGQITFVNFSDMYYDLFMELGLGIDANSYLYDQDTDMPILFKEKYIKANITVSYDEGSPSFTEAYSQGFTNGVAVNAGYYQSTVALIPEYNM